MTVTISCQLQTVSRKQINVSSFSIIAFLFSVMKVISDEANANMTEA